MRKNTYHIITIGCQMNKSDSERIAGYLEKHGYKKSAERKKAGLVVLVTCGVRQSAEDRIYGLAPKIKKENPNVRIVLTGCLANREDVKRRLKDKVDVWLPINKIFNFSARGGPASGWQFSNKKQKEKISCDKDNYLSIKPKYSSKFSALVPIGNGCNNFCSYCVVPYARGREIYRPAEDILKEIKRLVKRDYKEIILIAQNVNSYKYKNSKLKTQSSKRTIEFTDLLRMVNNIPGKFWIRFLTSHPKDMSDELIKTIAERSNPPSSRLRRARVCGYIHLPVQAGDDKILRAMNRNYTVNHYKSLIKKIRRVMPDAVITTDVIVGFPGETKSQFNNTAKLFKEIKFDMAYISQYSPRSGTMAEKLKDNISKAEKKRREELLMKILRKTALENNKEYVNKIIDVLVEGKNKRGEWYGKTETAKNVKFPIVNNKINLIGKFVKVKIIKARDFGLEGEVVKSDCPKTPPLCHSRESGNPGENRKNAKNK